MRKGRTGPTGPVGMVGAFMGAPTKGRRRRGSGVRPRWFGRRRKSGLSRVLAGPLPPAAAKRIPNRRRRRAMLRDAHSRLDRVATAANKVATVVGLAATCIEVLGALRGG